MLFFCASPALIAARKPSHPASVAALIYVKPLTPRLGLVRGRWSGRIET